MKQLELPTDAAPGQSAEVRLGDGQLRSLLDVIGSPVDQMSAFALLCDAGWTPPPDIAAGIVERLREGEPSWPEMWELMAWLGNRAPDSLLVLALEIAVKGGHFGVLREEWFPAELDGLPLGLLQTGLDAVVRTAVVDVLRGAVTPLQAVNGDAFPFIGAWLEDIAPLAFPDVEQRFAWFLGAFCDQVEQIPREDRWILTEPILTWWPTEPHSLRHVVDLLAATEAWRGVLDDDSFEYELDCARQELGLDEGEE